MRKIRKKRQKIKNIFATSPTLRRAVIVLGVLGSICIAIFIALTFKQHSFENGVYAMQKKGIEQVQKMEKESKTGTNLGTADYSAADVGTLTPSDLQKVDAAQQINQYGAGVLEIPAIALSLPILEGMTQANLSVGAGTAKPGQQVGKGNFALLGHYMTNRGVLFGGLRYLQKGNVINVTYQDKKAEYEVTESKVIHKSEAQYMEDSKDSDKVLTLITCDSSREGTPNRLMVRAKLVR